MIYATMILAVLCGVLLLVILRLWRRAGELRDRIRADESWLRSMNVRLQAVEVRVASLDARVRAVEAQGVGR